jgi:transposase
MIGLFNKGIKIYLAVEPCDMRKSFNGLTALALNHLEEALVKEALFVFTNKPRNRIKLLYFDGTGLWVAAKRLEEGTFNWTTSAQPGAKKIALAPEALQLLIDGVELRSAGRRAWYESPMDSA